MNECYLICPQAHFYELGTLIREYFPLIHVLEQKVEGAWGLVLSDDEMTATLYDEQGTVVRVGRAVEDVEVPFEHFIGDPAKNHAKTALSRALGEFLPWGILTGVRPSKIAYAYLEQGFTETEITDFLERGYHLRSDKAQLTAKVAAKERSLMACQQGEDVSVYIGVPFCPTRCSYCSFISNDSRAYKRYHEDYADCLVKEILSAEELFDGRRVRSLYMGGGTPTTLSAEELQRVLKAVSEVVSLDRFLEITVEAGRPDTVTREKLEVLKAFGVNRISINPQTMNQKTLDLIGRRHTVEDIQTAMELARRVSDWTINMDLILGLPEEGPEEVAHTFEEIERLAPDNLTVHTLAVKRASRMNEEGEGAKMLLEDPRALARQMDDMIASSAALAQRMGLEPYYMYRQKNMAGNFENVGYSLPGKEGLYNIEIMEERQNILAFGAGGVSKIYEPAINRISRIPNVKTAPEYISRIDEMISRKRANASKS